MAIRIPFFGMLKTSPLSGILEHYEQIANGMKLIEESIQCYVSSETEGNVCKEFSSLEREVSAIEEHADTIKRYIRNHLPSRLFLPIEKHLFFSYTRMQDDILNHGQNALKWLALRPIEIPEVFQKELVEFLGAVATSVNNLLPALKITIGWIEGNPHERSEIKEHFKAVRLQHKKVTTMQHSLIKNILCDEELDFRTAYQLIHFVEELHKMSHDSEGCADLLRVMIAR